MLDMRTYSITICLTLLASAAFVARAQESGPQLGMGLLAGEAPGLDDGYLHFDGFVPLAGSDGESLIFFDGSLLLMNESSDQLGANVGLGGRAYCDSTQSLLGAYLYYDRRDLGLDEFDQIGVGFESLGDLFDARINVNAPLNEREASNVALTTVDGEVGALLLEDDLSSIRLFVGVYGLLHSEVDSSAGVSSRLEWRVGSRCYLGAYVQHDDLFDTTGGFTFSWRFGSRRFSSGSDSQRPYDPVRSRLADPVYRRKHIATGSTTGPDALVTTGAPTTPTTVEEPPVTTTVTEVETSSGRPYRPPVRIDL